MLTRNNTIETLVIVAGVSCSGKTTLLRKLKAEGFDTLPLSLRPSDPADYEVCNAVDLVTEAGLQKTPAKMADTVYLHYDLFRPATFYDASGYGIDPVFEVCKRSLQIKVLTLWEDPDTLFERARLRRSRLWRKKLLRKPVLRGFPENYREYVEARDRRDKMQPIFSDCKKLWGFYKKWFEYCQTHSLTDHFVARPSDMAQVRSLKGVPQVSFWQD